MNQDRAEERVAIAIVRCGDQFLVGERAAHQALAGLAEFPGGRCQENESFEDCAARECREEAGLVVRILGLRQEIGHEYPHAKVRLAFFDCETEDARAPLPPFRWVPRAELAKLRFPEANAAVIAALV